MAKSLEVKFWGVRGSVAVGGPDVRRVGGNTSSVAVRAGDETWIFDAGTGIRALGGELAREGSERASLLLSHLHWDHIQGLPFFAPAWRPGFRLDVFGARSTSAPTLSLEEALAQQMEPPHFPVAQSAMRSSRTFGELADGVTASIGSARVTVRSLAHPDGVLAYRLELGGRSIVYATDIEHDTPREDVAPELWGPHDSALVALAEGADLLIYDAMYTDAEYRGEVLPSRRGWGHSTVEAATRIAAASHVGALALFHHDPSRDDRAIAQLERAARRRFSDTVAAREGLAITFDLTPACRAA